MYIVLLLLAISLLHGNAFVSLPSHIAVSSTLTCKVAIPRIPKDVYLEMSGKGFGAKASFAYAGDLRPGKASKAFPVPNEIAKPDYAMDGVPKLGRRKGDQVCHDVSCVGMMNM